MKVVASRDELIQKANQEGRLRALASIDEDSIAAINEDFKKKYPSIDFELIEFTGTDTYQRFLLELQSGNVGDWDVGYAPPEYYGEFAAYMDNYDLLAMSEAGVLNIPPKMIDPNRRNIATFASQLAGLTYNKKNVPESQVPKTWDDLLKPEWAGKKMVVDIRPSNIAPMVAAWGLDKTIDYSRKLAEQQPIWDRGQTNALNRLAAGDLLMHTFSNYHSAFRVQKRAPEDVGLILIEPIPGRISESLGVLKASKNPHAALLFLDYMASPTVQGFLDDLDPLKSSIYAPGSKLNQLVEGKQVSMADYEHFEQMDGYMEKIVEVFGFPKAELSGN